jgi:hypothetical protein
MFRQILNHAVWHHSVTENIKLVSLKHKTFNFIRVFIKHVESLSTMIKRIAAYSANQHTLECTLSVKLSLKDCINVH